MPKIRLFVVLIVFPFLFIACKAKEKREFFHLAYASGMITTNSILATDLTAYNFLHNIHEGLMNYSMDGLVRPGLLEEVMISDDGLTYELHLRSDLTFSDGSPLNTQAVLESWAYVLNPETHAPFAYLFDVIEGAREYREGLAEEIRGITILDERRMLVKLNYPFLFFLELLANPTFAILSSKWHHGQEIWESVSGAYRITHRDANGSLWLEVNPSYYDYSPEMIQHVKVSFISNNQVAYQLFKQQELDWLVKNIPLNLARRELRKDFLMKNPANGSYFILFNHTKAPYNDRRVRQALSMAIDRVELASILEEEPKANSYVTPFLLEREEVRFDLAEANFLLNEAGFNRDMPLKIRYRHSSSWLDRAIASYLQASWQKLAGVEVALEAIESAQYRGLWSSGDFDLIRVSWFLSDYEDSKDFLQNFTNSNTFMKSGYYNERFENLLLAADVASDLSTRQLLLKEAEELLILDDYATIGLFSPSNYHLIDKDKWQGVENNLKDIHLLRYIRHR